MVKKISVFIMIFGLLFVGMPRFNVNAEVYDNNVSVANTINISQVNSVENLASPDLGGKEYLGDGVYRIYNTEGVTLDYNVYNGIYTFNSTGTASTQQTLNIKSIVLPNDTYTFSRITVSGAMSFDSYPYITTKLGTQFQIYSLNSSSTDIINQITPVFVRFFLIRTEIVINYQFKLQLEKGDTATDYTVPKQALEQHIQFEKDSSYNDGLSDGFEDGSNFNIEVPTVDNVNDVWLDGNQVNDVYYRNDIVYDGITYAFFEEIQQAYIDKIIPANTVLYIDLNPMYNYIFAKREDQGSGLYYWTELGTLNPEEITYIKTMIIDKDGVLYKNDSFNGYINRYLWDDFDTQDSVVGNSLIGYANDGFVGYYDYSNGYDDGYYDGLERGRDIGYEKGRDEYGTYYNRGSISGRYGWYGYYDGYEHGEAEGYANGYDDGIIEQDATGFVALLSVVFGGLGTLLSIELLPGIYIGAIIAVPLVFGIIFFILGKRKGD